MRTNFGGMNQPKIPKKDEWEINGFRGIDLGVKS